MFRQILNPSKNILTLYGVVSLFFLVAYVWNISFVWEYFSSVTFYVIGLLVILLVGLYITFHLDKNFKWKTKQYFKISIIQLVIIWGIANPIRTWQIDSSYTKARLIIEPLKTYKLQYGQYPTTLTELEEKLHQSIPTRTNIGTRYRYELNGGQDYTLHFISYYGYAAYYNNEKDKWVLTD